MSKVASDLEGLMGFRDHLKEFNTTLKEEFSAMRAHWYALGDVWTDRKYDEFGELLDEVAKGVDHYIGRTDEFEDHLLRLIESLQSYLEARI
jgi:hypothetical protein